MKFVVLMYSDPNDAKTLPAADLDVVLRKHEVLRTELTESGELLNGAGLAHPETTKTIRMREGVPAAVDGPFAEAEVHLTAYYVIDCETVERAHSIAEGILDFHVTAVEVRQVHDSVGMEQVQNGGGSGSAMGSGS
jgi:hypothetical protein